MRTTLFQLGLVLSCLAATPVWGESAQQTLIKAHQAIDLASDLSAGLRFYQNPFAWEGKLVYFRGGYQQHIGPTQAVVGILPGNPATRYVVVVETRTNYADGLPIIYCVGKVLGMTTIVQGVMTRQVPHLEEVECVPQTTWKEHHARRTPAPPATAPTPRSARPQDAKHRYLVMIEDRIAGHWAAPPTRKRSEVVMQFHVARSGEITGILVAKSSGDQGNDLVAEQAVRDANPLPPFPEDMADSFLEITYRFYDD